MKSTIYILSGLGADKRVFRNIDFGNNDIVHIDWILPFKKEKLKDYCKRISLQITSENPILIGLSFGGIIALEISRLIKVKRVILISSAKTKYEIPFYYRFAGKLYLHKLLPSKLMRKSNKLTNWLFSVETREEKDLLNSILNETEPIFLKWAIDKIVSWENAENHSNISHIHGTSDKILPYKYVQNITLVINGGHFMVLNKADEISLYILNKINTNN